MSLVLLIFTFIGALHCSAERLLIHVDKDGTDTAECIQGETSCLTVNYALSSLQDQKSDSVPAIEILVSSPQKFNCEGIYDFKFTNLTIIGEDVVFSGLFGMMFEPDLKSTYVHMKGVHFENCRQTQGSDPFNPGVVFAFIETLIFEQCIVSYGSSLFVRVQNLTVDSCTFKDFNSSSLPVLTSWVSFPGYKFMTTSDQKQPPTPIENGKSRIGSIVVRNSSIVNNTGEYLGPSDDYPGPGIMLVDLSGLPLDTYFDIVHYDILIMDCSITNNLFDGKTTPFLSVRYSQKFSANFTLMNSHFVNNSIIPKKGDLGFDSFPLLSLTQNTNATINFTVIKSSFVNYSLPLSALLGSSDSVSVKLNVFESVFQGSVPLGLQVVQDLSGTSTDNISTNFKGNKHVT